MVARGAGRICGGSLLALDVNQVSGLVHKIGNRQINLTVFNLVDDLCCLRKIGNVLLGEPHCLRSTGLYKTDCISGVLFGCPNNTLMPETIETNL